MRHKNPNELVIDYWIRQREQAQAKLDTAVKQLGKIACDGQQRLWEGFLAWNGNDLSNQPANITYISTGHPDEVA